MNYMINTFADILGFVLLVISIPTLLFIGARLFIYLQDKRIDWAYKRQADAQSLRQQQLLNDSQEIANQQQIQDLALVRFTPNEPVLPRQQLLQGDYSEAMLVLAAKYLETLQPVANVPTTLTYSPSVTYKNDTKGLATDAPVMDKLLAANPILDFGQLYQQHLLPKDSFLLGASLEDGQFVNAGWKEMYSTLVIGQSGSGKSTLVRSILAQAALQGSKFMVLDPHFGAGEESLGQSLTPLNHLMLTSVAANDQQMLAALKNVMDIGKNRLAGIDKDKTPVVLIVDETTGLLSRGAIAPQLIDTLGFIAQETRKVGVYAICLGQIFTTDVFPSNVRNAFVNFISCRTRKDNARCATGNTHFSTIAENLTIGQAVRMTPGGAVQILQVPNCTQQHLEMVAGENGVFEAKKLTTSTTSTTGITAFTTDDFDTSGSTLEVAGKHFGSGQNDARTQRIITMFCDGASKNDMVKDLSNGEVTGGRRYQETVDEIDRTIRNYVRELQGGK